MERRGKGFKGGVVGNMTAQTKWEEKVATHKAFAKDFNPPAGWKTGYSDRHDVIGWKHIYGQRVYALRPRHLITADGHYLELYLAAPSHSRVWKLASP